MTLRLFEAKAYMTRKSGERVLMHQQAVNAFDETDARRVAESNLRYIGIDPSDLEIVELVPKPAPRLKSIGLLAFLEDGTCHQVNLRDEQIRLLMGLLPVLFKDGEIKVSPDTLPITTQPIKQEK